jgi:16S rRNA (cytosine967-C5)-methyltransferase
VLDALRRRRSLAWRMGDDSPRAAVLCALVADWDWSFEQIADAAAETPHGPGALSELEESALNGPKSVDGAPAFVQGDYPEWLDEPLARAFGEARIDEAKALARRAGVDIRVNTLKTDRERTLKALGALGAAPSDWLATAVRAPPPRADERAPALEAAPEFAKGWFEVQDLGSQIAACAAGTIKGRQVLDLCAGGGGKTLALAAAMGNSGQLYAYDADSRRLAETVRRAQRAGVRNLQVKSPLRPGVLDELQGRMDVVFVDAPCTGSGTWRRHPDAKWRLTPAQLQRRVSEQDEILNAASAYVRASGRIVYVTCSLLREENEDRIAAFLAGHPEFGVQSAVAVIEASGLATPAALAGLAERASGEGFLRLSPASAGCDGFFIAVLERRP